MKKIYLLFILFLATVYLVAQTPQAFKYQAIARDNAGNILSYWEIGLKVIIVQGDQDGQEVYTETHQVTSNIYGLINLVIGNGTVQKGNFNNISWGRSSHSIKLEMDIDGGTNYKEIGSSQLFAVPYALYAEQAGSLKSSSGSGSGSSSSSSSSRSSRIKGTPNTKFPADTSSYLNLHAGSVGIGTDDPQEKLDVTGKIMASEGFNTNGHDGLTDSLNVVTDIDFAGTMLKYQTLALKGGIFTFKSDKSGWVDTVGNKLDFACGDSLLDVRDLQKYSTVLIGTQCWFAKNLNIGSRIDGGVGQTNTGTIEKYCYGDIPANCDTNGGLYQWDQAMQYETTEGVQGICPDGWHIPTSAEWDILMSYLGGFTVAGGKMKETGTSYWASPNTGATNESGFTCYGSGYSNSNGLFHDLLTVSFLWSSTQMSESNASGRKLTNSSAAIIFWEQYGKAYGYSVRCVKD